VSGGDRPGRPGVTALGQWRKCCSLCREVLFIGFRHPKYRDILWCGPCSEKVYGDR